MLKLVSPTRAVRRLARRLRGTAGDLRRDEDGAVIMMVAFTISSLIIVVGGAVDVYRYEMLRQKAQNTLDRAVLASSALEQKIEDSERVVRSYMQSEGLDLPPNTRFEACPKAGPSVCCPKEAQAQQIRCFTDWRDYSKSFRSMSVTATYEMPMAFLWLAGQKQWDVPVQSAAIERERNVEVSVVLDLSGSMGQNVSGQSVRRIDALKPATANFVDTLLTPDARDLTSISLVPYAGQVSLGREMFDHLAGPGYVRDQDYSSCFHLESSDFGPGVPDFARRDQVKAWTGGAHHNGREYVYLPDNRNNPNGPGRWTPNTRFHKNQRKGNRWIVNSSPFNCPSDAYVYWRGNVDQFALRRTRTETLQHDQRFWLRNRRVPELKDGRMVKLWSSDLFYEVGRCDATQSRWGPRTCAPTGTGDDTRFVNEAMNQGDVVYVDDAASISYLSNDPDYLKRRIANMPLYGSTGTDVALKYASMLVDPAFQPRWESAMRKKVLPRAGRPASFDERPAAYDDPNTFKFIVVMTDGRIKSQYKARSSNPDVTYGWNRNWNYSMRYNERVAGNRFAQLCEDAEKNGVEIFTIGFDLIGEDEDTKDTKKSLEECASTPSHYFDVEGGDLDAAFQAIAAAIQKVRLTS